MATFFGIDFGTSNSVLSINKNGKTMIVDIDEFGLNKKTLRSALYFNETDKFVGQQAINKYIKEKARGRFMQSIKSFLPSKVSTHTFIYGQRYELEDLIVLILKKIKEKGEQYAGDSIDSVIAGRPAIFSDDIETDKIAQQRLESAFKKAGFKNIKFQYEPIAAALKYESTLKEGENKVVLVGDFGGGTSDFAVVKVSGNSKIKKHNRKKDILSVGGVYVGGDMFDSKIMREKIAKYFGKDVQHKTISGDNLGLPAWIVSKFCKWHLIHQLRDRETLKYLEQLKNIVDEPQAISNLINIINDNFGYMLFREIEKAKCELSFEKKAKILFKEKDLFIDETITRKEFENIIFEEVEKIKKCIDDTVKNSGLKSSDVNTVFLTGGSSYIPCIRDIFIRKFGREKIAEADIFVSVAEGLALSEVL